MLCFLLRTAISLLVSILRRFLLLAGCLLLPLQSPRVLRTEHLVIRVLLLLLLLVLLLGLFVRLSLRRLRLLFV